jgi:multidrug resistance efflux pump
VTGGHDPREVLEAVRRLEVDIEELRARSRPGSSELHALEEEIAARAAEERRAIVEDLEVVVDLIGASWRRAEERADALARDVAELRRVADDLRRALGSARLELRLGPLGGNGAEADRADVPLSG